MLNIGQLLLNWSDIENLLDYNIQFIYFSKIVLITSIKLGSKTFTIEMYTEYK